MAKTQYYAVATPNVDGWSLHICRDAGEPCRQGAGDGTHMTWRPGRYVVFHAGSEGSGGQGEGDLKTRRSG